MHVNEKLTMSKRAFTSPIVSRRSKKVKKKIPGVRRKFSKGNNRYISHRATFSVHDVPAQNILWIYTTIYDVGGNLLFNITLIVSCIVDRAARGLITLSVHAHCKKHRVWCLMCQTSKGKEMQEVLRYWFMSQSVKVSKWNCILFGLWLL